MTDSPTLTRDQALTILSERASAYKKTARATRDMVIDQGRIVAEVYVACEVAGIKAARWLRDEGRERMSSQSDYDRNLDNTKVCEGDERTHAQWQRDVAVTTLLKVLYWARRGGVIYGSPRVVETLSEVMPMLGVTVEDYEKFCAWMDGIENQIATELKQ